MPKQIPLQARNSSDNRKEERGQPTQSETYAYQLRSVFHGHFRTSYEKLEQNQKLWNRNLSQSKQ
jgi:hypothetical protein